MTDTELNIKIAEKCGWKGIVPQFAIGYAPWRPKSYSEACMGDLDSIPQDPIPDYCNDLNAMAEAEEIMNKWERTRHGRILQDIVGSYCVGYVPDHERDLASLSYIASAKARQRAEAFARVFNLI